ncbi:MAG: M56 family metallopeptidase [Chitinophagaceae bacterium]
MNLSELAHSAFLKALGWAVLNSLWQFALLWLIFIALINSKKGLSSSIKHGLALVFLSAGSVWFITELYLRYFNYQQSQYSTQAGNLSQSVFSTHFLSSFNLLESNLPFISSVYLFVVGILFIKFSFYFYHSRTIRTQGLSKVRAQLRLYVQQRAEHLGIRRKVQVYISAHVNTPMIIGFLKPMILIPVACINQLSTRQLEAILLHELAHIKRNDYLVNLFVATAEIFFFFNPFSKLLVNVIKQERETSCDDWVLQFRFDPHQYATALLSLEQSRSASFTTGLAATGESNNILLHRIQRILYVKTTEKNNRLKFIAYLLTMNFFFLLTLINPGQLKLKKLPDTAYAQLVSQPSAETNNLIIHSIPPESIKIKKPVKTTVKTAMIAGTLSKSTLPVMDDLDENSLTFTLSAIHDPGFERLPQLVSAIEIEERDYSIIEKDQSALPPLTYNHEHPFVPNTSFSYQDPEDTTKPKIKKESYHELIAREALLNTQKAIEKIDWKSLQKHLKNKSDVAQVKKAIQQSLEQLNWQEINNEVTQALNKENIEKLKKSLNAEYNKVRSYKVQQQQYQQLHNELKLQQEMYKKEVEHKQWEINKQIAKQKIIVHI